MRAVEAPSTRALRGWQRRALVRYLSAKPRDYLLVATPGAGKTAFALRIAGELLADRSIDAITVVVPTEHLKVQWATAAAIDGIALDPKFSNSAAHTSAEYHGVVVTYAQVASHPTRHRVRTEGRRTLVIFDEIHHGGDAKSWGDAIREAFGDATRRLALTGTPFRSDDSPIPFVRYERDAAGFMRSQADHTYDYTDALADGVVRPVVFMAYSGETRWRDSAGEEHAARLGEPATAEHTARAWRTALDPANLTDLQAFVRENNADIGLAFDGDADRCFVIDERGLPVSPSTVTALVAARELSREIGATVIHNLITSRAVPELVIERGGTPVRARVGHSYIKALMAETGAIFGGEHSAHYYFRDFWGADSGMLAALYVLAALGSQEGPLSELTASYQRYEASGEINFTVRDSASCVEAVLKGFSSRIQSIDHLDGVTVDLGEGSWFNLRTSNTEPLLRLNVEGRCVEDVDAVVEQVAEEIRRQVGQPEAVT